MNKIIQVINKMIDNRRDIFIVNSIKGDSNITYFVFEYKNYSWVLWKYKEFYSLGYSDSIKNLLKNPPEPQIVYSSQEFKGTEAKESFSELYQTLIERTINIDEVIDDILNDDYDASNI